MMSQISAVFTATKPYFQEEEDATIDVAASITKLCNASNMEKHDCVKGIVETDSKTKTETEDVESWETSTHMNSLASIASIATMKTSAYSELLGHSGKIEDDITADAFMGLPKLSSKEASKQDVLVIRNPFPVPSNQAVLHSSALRCIAQRNFSEFFNIIKHNPSLLLYQCKKGEHQQIERVHGCYGGTLLHVMVSQTPNKRVTKSTNRFSKPKPQSKGTFEIHVMPSVPENVLLYVIKRHPEALAMTDDYGRLPIHCATLSLSNHLEEMSRLCSLPLEPSSTKSENTISRYVIQEINIVKVLLKYYKGGASKIDQKGCLPLHYAVSMAPDYKDIEITSISEAKEGGPPSAEDTVKALLNSYPRGIGVKNKKSQLPIHIISSLGSMINMASLQHLLDFHHQWKDLPMERDASGDPPLHLAVKSRVSHHVVQKFASLHRMADIARLFLQSDGNNNNILHVALGLLHPPPNESLVSVIMSTAPTSAGSPDHEGIMPIKYAVKHQLPDEIIMSILAQDMPIRLGTMTNQRSSSESSHTSCLNVKHASSVSLTSKGAGLLGQEIKRMHHNSWWYIAVDCGDRYIHALQLFLSRRATHSQIAALARQVGPDGKSVFIKCVSNKCRLMIHSLLRFYDRYEILLSSDASKVRVHDGVQSLHALDFGPLLASADDNGNKLVHKRASTAVKVGGGNGPNMSVEVSLLWKEKGKVLLRCYEYEDAFLAEIRVRELRNLSSTFVEEIYNYHRDENYTNLTSSKAENLCCIIFARPDHTLEEVFQSISPSSRSQKWIEKCWVVLRQIAEALKHIHDRNLIHGHLHSANISKYGNLWKLSNVGTVVQVGHPLRGLLRPCSPPESIIVSPLASGERVGIIGNQTLTSPDVGVEKSQPKRNHHNRVKFSSSVGGEKKTLALRAFAKKYNRTAMLDSQSSNTASSLIPEVEDRKSNSDIYCGSFLRFGEKVEDVKNISREAQDANVKGGLIDPESSITCPWLFAPENCIASPAWDMWGFGLVMVQLLLGRCTSLPNFEKADDAILRSLYHYDTNTLKKIVTQIQNSVGKDAADLVSQLLQRNPAERPKSMSAVLEHNYFKKLTIYI